MIGKLKTFSHLKRAVAVAAICATLAGAQPAVADEMSGKVLVAQGHIIPGCRMVQLRNSSDQSLVWFRIPDTGADGSMLAVLLTALAANLTVTIAWDPGITTGCGSEPRIAWVSIHSAG